VRCVTSEKPGEHAREKVTEQFEQPIADLWNEGRRSSARVRVMLPLIS
jgi:hypothetical protein